MGGIVRRATAQDAERLNAIANHPDVLPFISQNGLGLDLSASIGANKVYVSDYGALFFEHKGGEVYELHTMFLPAGRGRHALKASKQIFQTMFNEGAAEIITHTPDDNPQASPPLTFGFKPKSHVKNYFRGHGATLWVLPREKWRHKCL